MLRGFLQRLFGSRSQVKWAGASQHGRGVAIPSFAEEFLDIVRSFHMATYEKAVSLGVADIVDGPLSRCGKGQRCWRIHLTNDYSEIMRTGPKCAAFQALVAARAEMNSRPLSEVLDRTTEERRVLVSPTRGSDFLDAAIAEVVGPYEQEPDMVEAGGRWHHITVEPSEYLKLAPTRLAKLISFLSQFGKDKAAVPFKSMLDIRNYMNMLDEGIVKEGTVPRAELWRSYQQVLGIDLERYRA